MPPTTRHASSPSGPYSAATTSFETRTKTRRMRRESARESGAASPQHHPAPRVRREYRLVTTGAVCRYRVALLFEPDLLHRPDAYIFPAAAIKARSSASLAELPLFDTTQISAAECVALENNRKFRVQQASGLRIKHTWCVRSPGSEQPPRRQSVASPRSRRVLNPASERVLRGENEELVDGAR